MPQAKGKKQEKVKMSGELEDYRPGATKEEVMAALKRTAKPTEEPSPRRSKQPEK